MMMMMISLCQGFVRKPVLIASRLVSMFFSVTGERGSRRVWTGEWDRSDTSGAWGKSRVQRIGGWNSWEFPCYGWGSDEETQHRLQESSGYFSGIIASRIIIHFIIIKHNLCTLAHNWRKRHSAEKRHAVGEDASADENCVCVNKWSILIKS